MSAIKQFMQKPQLKRLIIDQVIKVYKNIQFFSKISCQNENIYNSANFEAISPILFLNCQKYTSTTIYCLKNSASPDGGPRSPSKHA